MKFVNSARKHSQNLSFNSVNNKYSKTSMFRPKRRNNGLESILISHGVNLSEQIKYMVAKK